MSDGLAELREHMDGVRVFVKSAQRTLRGLGQILADLSERLETFENAQPEEAERANNNGKPRERIQT